MAPVGVDEAVVAVMVAAFVAIVILVAMAMVAVVVPVVMMVVPGSMLVPLCGRRAGEEHEGGDD